MILVELEMLTWICTILINRGAETKKFDKTAKYEGLTITSSKVMSKKQYFCKGVFFYIKRNTICRELEHSL